MAEALSIAPEHVVGCLIQIWVWADQQTTDGNAPGVTRTLVDRKSGVAGFADAMLSCGWLVETEQGLAFPNFDAHNGKTAKSRALTAKRVAKHRGECNAEGNAAAVTSPLAREEKRREEKERGKSAPKKGSRIPEDFPTDDEIDWAKENAPAVNVTIEAHKFRDYWVALPGQKGVKLDWPATWRNWIRRCAPSAPRESNGPRNLLHD